MLFQLFGPTVRNAAHKPVTRRYPFEPYVPMRGTRGRIDIDIDACTFCLACQKRCPTNAIVVDRPGRSWQIDRLSCIQCGRCTEVCPKHCLMMAGHYSSPVTAQARADAVNLFRPTTPAPAPGAGRAATAAERATPGAQPAPTEAAPAGAAPSPETSARAAAAPSTAAPDGSGGGPSGGAPTGGSPTGGTPNESNGA